jgi:hypothetical protein
MSIATVGILQQLQDLRLAQFLAEVHLSAGVP